MKTEYTAAEAAKAMGGKLLSKKNADLPFSELLLDSRKLIHARYTLFFALSGLKLDGHHYIEDLYKKGVRNFVVTQDPNTEVFSEANFILVKDAVAALQKLAGFHRGHFNLPVIAITGSNGKTIVKEWLYQLLHEDYHIIRSPKSYNSQIGVPLSLWLINPQHNLGIFEAGISELGEMAKLEHIIAPTIGVFTNIGEAHSEGFLNIKHKTKEKLTLFSKCNVLIYCKDYPDINQSLGEINSLRHEPVSTFSWSMTTSADLNVSSVMQKNNRSFIHCVYNNTEFDFDIPFSDRASVENALHCACVMLYLGKSFTDIRQRMQQLSGIQMRLEMRDAINHCSLINDTYNSDISSLKIALDFLKQQNQHPHKTVILSDILQSGRSEVDLYSEVAALLAENKVNRLIGIGVALSKQKKLFEKNEHLQLSMHSTTESFLQSIDAGSFNNEVVLLKGARPFRFELIAKFLERKAHETVLEINLNALTNNLKTYQQLLLPSTKIMAMVKAFSYGSGSFEIANILQFNRVDYLAVAYADEGVELRKNGITLPIMVMNPEQRSFETMIQHGLEPEIYSLNLLDSFSEVLAMMRSGHPAPYPIHLELETGMNRLGFSKDDIPALIERIKNNLRLRIASVFSHLAASEDKAYDDFTKEQIRNFELLSKQISEQFNYKILRHILNSSGITRHVKAQFDMVRLGIGLYGIDNSDKLSGKLMPVSTLKTTISQIKHVKKGETVGYGRVGKVSKNKSIATIAIGYADGLSRKLSNGAGQLFVNGKPAPVIGNVCMDMTMLDITGIDAAEGDEVVVFGTKPTVQEIAEAAGTIPYEILTGISGRVKRVYYQE